MDNRREFGTAAVAPINPASASPDRYLKGWVSLSIALAIEVGLQLSPITGIFLMFLAGPFWSLLLINLILLQMALDAWANRSRRWLLLVPAVVFGGCLTAGLAAEVLARTWVKAIDHQNAAVLVRDGRPLAIESSIAGADTAKAVAGGFDLPVVYRWQGAPENTWEALRVVPRSVCDSLKFAEGSQVRFDDRNLTERRGGSTFSWPDPNRCVVATLEAPPADFRRVKVDQYEEGNVLVRKTVVRIGLGDDAALVTGIARPFPLAPLFIAGCFLNSGAPAWDCMFEPLRRSVSASQGHDADAQAKLIGRAMGLTARPLGAPSTSEHFAVREAVKAASAAAARAEVRREAQRRKAAARAAKPTYQPFFVRRADAIKGQ